jgi:hypothetical protein
VAGSCEDGNEPSGSIKGEVFLEKLTKSFRKRALFRGFRHTFHNNGGHLK